MSLLLPPITVHTVILFALMGGVVGELLFLFVLTIKQAYKKDTVISYYDDGSPAKFFITGDKRRHFDRVKGFCREMDTRQKDVLIILGDSGFNYYDDKRDDELKKSRHLTLLCSVYTAIKKTALRTSVHTVSVAFAAERFTMSPSIPIFTLPLTVRYTPLRARNIWS